MFSRDVEYSIDYTRDGAPYVPDDLRGRAPAIRGEPMHTRDGAGAVRRWVRGYLRAHPGVEAVLGLCAFLHTVLYTPVMKAALRSADRTIRLGADAHRVLRALADERGRSMQATLEEAVEAYRRQRFLECANESYARLRARPADWKLELDERRAWDRASRRA